jgi:hypothetical protein
MKNTFLIVVFLALALHINAQNEVDKKYLLTNYQNSGQITMLNITDPYLSPLPYSGIGLNYNFENSRFLATENNLWSNQNKLNLEGGIMLNPQSSAAMMYLGLNYGWGMQYHFRIKKGFQILAGGLWDVDLGFKYLDRNVNNPVNLDLATNLNLTALAKYDIQLRKKQIQLQIEVQTPVIGCMFVPLAGASYYEMFQLGNLSDAFHVSSPINKRGLNTKFIVQVPFENSVWHFGIRTVDLKYSANNLVFTKNEFSLVVGITFDAIHFSGRKSKVPDNFISPNE